MTQRQPSMLTVMSDLPTAGAIQAGIDSYVNYLLPLILLPFISSAFVPTESMPGPVRAFAEHQPVTSIVDAIRDLFAGQPVGSHIWVALGWCVGILAVTYGFAVVYYRRKIS
jgi:ABC-2 type transport system permease protein